MTGRIAVATSDGKNIDLHFASASQFYIYDAKDNRFDFVEERKCDAVYMYEEKGFELKLKKLDDCEALIVSRIGAGALAYLSLKGIRVFEAPYPVEDVLTKMLDRKILGKPGRVN